MGIDLWEARLLWPNLSFGPNLNIWPSVLKVFAISLSGRGCLGHGSAWDIAPKPTGPPQVLSGHPGFSLAYGFC